MPITYSIHKEIDLLFTVFQGKVNLQDGIDYTISLFKEKDIKHTSRSLNYLKDSKLKFEVDDVEQFADHHMAHSIFESRRKIAILIDSPIDTVAATIFAQTLLSSSRKVEIELFYTLEAALLFLGLVDKKEVVQTVIDNTIKISL